MVRNDRILANPFKKVDKVDEAGTKKRERRAFTEEELKRLISASPDHRALAYFTAARSGLRYQELKELEWRDVVFQDDSSHFHVRASTTTNKKEARLPLVPQLRDWLLEFRSSSASDTEKIFRSVPRPETLYKDLKSAGIPRIDKTDRFLGWHSFRVAWATFLHLNDVPKRTTMEFMRHSDRKLTNKVYTDRTLLPLAERVLKLPELEGVLHIRIQNSGKTGQNVSQAGEIITKNQITEVVDNESSSRSLSQVVGDRLMVPRAGLEPARLHRQWILSPQRLPIPPPGPIKE